MLVEPQWLLAAVSLLAVLFAGAAVLAAHARHSVQYRVAVRYARRPARPWPVFECLFGAGSALALAVVLNQLVVDETPLVRIAFAATIPAVLIAAGCWVWVMLRDRAIQMDDARLHWRQRAAGACRQIRESFDIPAIHASACAALSEGLDATDIRLYLRDGRVFPLAYSTTGREGAPRDYQSGSPLVESLAQLPACQPWPFDDDGPHLALPFSLGAGMEGFFVAVGGPYPRPQLEFAHEIAREAGRALAVAALLAKQAEIRAAKIQERRELDQTRRVLQHLVPPDQPTIPGVEFAVDSWRGDLPGGQFIDVIALPKGVLGLVVADLGGYGLETAARMAQLQTLVRSRFWAYADDLPELYQSVERALLNVRPVPGPVRLFLAAYRPGTRTATYLNAGALAPLLLRRGGEGAQVLRLTSTAPRLLANAGEPVQCAELVLETGDLMAAFSPGVSDALSPASEPWGDARLTETLLQWETRSAADLAPLVLRAAAEHTAHQAAAHDRILFLLKAH